MNHAGRALPLRLDRRLANVEHAAVAAVVVDDELDRRRHLRTGRDPHEPDATRLVDRLDDTDRLRRPARVGLGDRTARSEVEVDRAEPLLEQVGIGDRIPQCIGRDREPLDRSTVPTSSV